MGQAIGKMLLMETGKVGKAGLEVFNVHLKSSGEPL